MTYPAIVIVDYDPQWPESFAKEKLRILDVLGPRAVAVEHVGSTSVPGLAAKPIIDIVVGVRDLAITFGECVRPLQGIGYEHIPMPSVWDRRFFQRGIWRMGTHHLHLTEFGGATWHDYVLFRDHLRAHPEIARQYLALKRRIAARPNVDRPAYSAAKGPFINGVVAEIIAARARAGQG